MKISFPIPYNNVLRHRFLPISIHTSWEVKQEIFLACVCKILLFDFLTLDYFISVNRMIDFDKNKKQYVPLQFWTQQQIDNILCDKNQIKCWFGMKDNWIRYLNACIIQAQMI